MVSKLTGARLAFNVERIDVPLGELQSRFASDAGGSVLEAPEVAPPDIDPEALELAPIRDLAIKELISHARSGQATIHLPLHAAEKRVGPLKVTIQEGSEAVIDLEVRDGVIVREATRGQIVPPIGLPLGLSFKGLYLDDTGAIWVDIENFPDLNLSFLALDRIRVPGTMDEVLELVFGDGDDEEEGRGAESATAVVPEGDISVATTEDGASESTALVHRPDVTEEESPPSSASGENEHIDVSRIAVQARGVVPRAEPFHLGHAGEIEIGGEQSRLDVDYSQDHLAVRGRVELTGARLGGNAFALEGMRGLGTLSVVLDGIETLKGLEVGFEGHHGHADLIDVRLPDGTRFHVTDANIEGLSVSFTRSQDAQRFRVASKNIDGRFEGGAVMLKVGHRPVPIELGAFTANGSVDFSDQHYGVDLNLEGAQLKVAALSLHLGLAELQVKNLEAVATGRLKAGTDFGFSFTGSLQVKAEVDDGAVAIGPVGAGLAAGTKFDLVVEDIAGGPEGIDALVASGAGHVRLRSGSLPLGEQARLEFSRGAAGEVTLKKVTLAPGQRWPTVDASLKLMAQADACVIQELFEIPAGAARVEVPKVSVDDNGHLVVCDLKAWLASDKKPENEA